MPKWLDQAVFYEIYPQSFQDTNGDGIGDLEGIIRRLDYIRSLGANAIWINPCFVSPFGDAGYDVADYCRIAPRYGTNEDARRLFEEVHKRGMHVLLDLVPGHTSVEHPWFLESKKAERNEYSDRYIWTNSVWESTELLACLRGISDRDGSCAVNFFSSQPALNYGNANPHRAYQMSPGDPAPLATREAIKNVMRFWLEMGCDGFRVDMAGSLVKNDPDGAATMKLWQDFRAFLDAEYPEAAIVSEWGQPEKAILGGFHMDFLLHFGPAGYNSLFRCKKPFFSSQGEGDISVFAQQYQKSYDMTRGRGLICIPSGNHDMKRLALGRTMSELKLCFAFLLTMPGAPFLYYGDEIGMQYLEGLTSVEGGYFRTGSRSPMQWDTDAPNRGFSSCDAGNLYIQEDPDPNAPTVSRQEKDKDSLLSEIKSLLRLRSENTPLQSWGGFEFLFAEKDSYPLIYRRFDDSGEICIILNPRAEEASAVLDRPLEGKVLHTVGKNASLRLRGNCVFIPGESAVILKTK